MSATPPRPVVSFESRIVLRPRSLDETFDLAIAYLRASAGDLGRLALLLSASASALVLGIALAFELDGRRCIALALFVTPFVERVMTVYGGRHLFRNEARASEALWLVLKRSPETALGAILKALPWTPFLFLENTDGVWQGVGILLALFWPLPLAASVYRGEVSLLERLPFARAGRRARALVNYRFGRALGLVITGTLVRLAIAWGTMLLIEFVLGLVLQFQEVSQLQSWTLLVGYLFAAPYIAVVRLFDYVDARTVREGWDIQVRFNAAVLGPAEQKVVASPEAAPVEPGRARALGVLILAVALSRPMPAHAEHPDGGPPALEAEEDEAIEDEELDRARVRRRVADQLTATATRGANARRAEFEADAYRFCHSETFGEGETEAADFCPLFDESSTAVCPAAAQRCAKWRRWQSVCAPHESGRSGSGTPDDPPGRTTEEDGGCPGPRGPSRIVLADRRQGEMGALGWRLPPAVGWTLITAGALLLLTWFVRTVRGAGWEPAPVDLAEVTAAGSATHPQALPEARSTTLLDAADRALENGDLDEATRLIHLALLRFFDDEGLARFHPSKTNGDYLRAVRREPTLAAAFRVAAREMERLRFGHGRPDPSVVRALLLDAARAVTGWTSNAAPSSESLLLILGVTALLGSTTSACGAKTGHDAAFDLRAPTGMYALPKVLRQAGLDVTLLRRNARITPEIGVVVTRTSAATSGSFPESIVMDGLLDRDVSIVLIDDLWQSRYFLPVTSTLSATRGRTDLELSPPSPRVFCTWRLDPLAAALDGRDVRIPEGRRLVDDVTTSATISASAYAMSIQPLLSYAGSPRVDDREAAHAYVAERVDAAGTTLAGCLYVFADRDLFTNASLTREGNARFVSAFFGALAGTRKILIIDHLDPDTLSGQDPEDAGWGQGGSGATANTKRSLEASNLLPLLGQAALTLLILFAAMGAAFGPLREPVHREHKAFVEHIEAIGRQYARTGVVGLVYSARALARWVVNRHREQLRGGAAGGWASLAKHLAERHQLDERDVRAALRLGIEGQSELGAPSLEDPPPESERMLRTLSRLARLGSTREK